MNSNFYKKIIIFMIAFLATFAFATENFTYINAHAEETTDAEQAEADAQDAADEDLEDEEDNNSSINTDIGDIEDIDDVDYLDRLDNDMDADGDDIQALDMGASDSDTKASCSKPKIICPSKYSYITVSGQQVSVTNRVTIGKDSKIFPVRFTRDYSYLFFSVKSGGSSYVSVNSSTGQVKGLKATGNNKVYITVSATVDGKTYSKNCQVRVYKEKSKYAETDEVIKTSNAAVDAFKVEATAPCSGTGVVNDGGGSVTCKNITITKGKTKTVYSKKNGVIKPNAKVFTTKIKNKNIKSVTVKLINNSKKNVAKQSSGKKLKGNKAGTINYQIVVKKKKGSEYSSGTCTIKVKKKSSKKSSKTTKKKSKKTKKKTSKKSSKKTKKKSSKKTSKKKKSSKKTTKKNSKKNNKSSSKNKTYPAPSVSYTINEGTGDVTYKIKFKYNVKDATKMVVKCKSIKTNNSWIYPDASGISGKNWPKKSSSKTYITSGGATATCKFVAHYKDGKSDPTTLKISASNIKKKKSGSSKTSPNSITISHLSSKMNVGDRVTAVANITPTTASQKVKWSSSNKSVATVSAQGEVVAKKAGTVKITATSSSNKDVKKTKTIKVSKSIAGLSTTDTSVVLPETINVSVKGTKTINAKLMPSNTSDNKVLTWKSSDNKIVTVSSKGVITGIKKGTATITATIPSNGYSASTTVTVGDTVNVSSVTASPSSMKIGVGENKTIMVTVSPANSSTRAVTYKSSDKKIASVSSNGQVSGNKKGTATITITSKNDTTKKAKVKVTVTKLNTDVSDITDFTMDESMNLERGQSNKLTINGINPKVITFSVDNKIITVDSDGTVNAIKMGTATITAKAGNFVKTCLVTVSNKVNVSDVTVNGSTNTIGKGQSVTLIATVAPENATNNSIKWSTSDKKIATVKDGVVTGVKKGTATITVTSKSDTTKKATFDINVVNEQVKLDEEVKEEVNDGKWENNPNDTSEYTTTLQVGNTTYAPWHEDGTYSKIADQFEIVVLNKEVADIDDDDLISANNVGTAVIELRRKEVTTTEEETNLTESTTSESTEQTSQETTQTTTKQTNDNNVVERLTITVVEKKQETTTSSIDGTTETNNTANTPKSNPKSISITIKSKKITVKKSRTAKATVSPSSASQTVKWSTSNKKVATVTKYGKIVGKKVGTATITATSTTDSKVKKSIKITVKKASKKKTSSSSSTSSSTGSSSSSTGGSTITTTSTSTTTGVASPTCPEGVAESQYSEYCSVKTGSKYVCPNDYYSTGGSTPLCKKTEETTALVEHSELKPISSDAIRINSTGNWYYCSYGKIKTDSTTGEYKCTSVVTKGSKKENTFKKVKKVCSTGTLTHNANGVVVCQ